MLCDICKQNVATVHLTQMVEGKTKKVDLCEACSKEKGVDDPTGFSLADLLLGLGAAQEMAQAAAGSDLKCPACGFTEADFKKNGRLGCADCYTTFSKGLDRLIKSMHKGNKLGRSVRGLYGEGTEALGNVFQVSNQMTLGEAETDIVERLNKVLTQLIEHEENARGSLLEKKPKMVFNHIGRAYGILANAHSISSKETMNLLSLMRLGIDLGMFPGIERSLVDELFILTQPAHLQKQFSEKLSAEERDLLRADMLRDRLRNVSRPVSPPPRSEGARPDKPSAS